MKGVKWASLNFQDKLALFNKWSILSFVGNLCTIFGSIFYLCSTTFAMSDTEVLIGIGCATNWLAVLRYFSHSPQYSIIMRTLKIAVPMNIKIMFGVLPIFIGYCLFAMSVFYQNRDFFGSFSDTSYAFFSIMNGDSILANFIICSNQNSILGQVMLYSFTFMAICVWQNMNLVIVEDSYLNVKYKSSYSWLKEDEVDQEGE